MILMGVGILGYFLAATRLPFALSELITGLGVNRYIIFALVIVFFLILGCLLNVIPMLLLVLPTIFPTVIALGFDPIWFGVILTINMELGLITPPVGLNLFVINGITPDIKLQTILKGALPFMGCMVVAILILCVFPELATWLPAKVMG